MTQTSELLIEVKEIIRRLARRSPDYAPEFDLSLRRKCSSKVLSLLKQKDIAILCNRISIESDGSIIPAIRFKNEWLPASNWTKRQFDFQTGSFDHDPLWINPLQMTSMAARIAKSEAQQLWPEIFEDADQSHDEAECSIAPEPAKNDDTSISVDPRKVGKPPEYDEIEFFALCAWEAHANELPDQRTDLKERMKDLLEIVWGKVPRETWLKKKLKVLYEAREKYERARQERPGE